MSTTNININVISSVIISTTIIIVVKTIKSSLSIHIFPTTIFAIIIQIRTIIKVKHDRYSLKPYIVIQSYEIESILNEGTQQRTPTSQCSPHCIAMKCWLRWSHRQCIWWKSNTSFCDTKCFRYLYYVLFQDFCSMMKFLLYIFIFATKSIITIARILWNEYSSE